MADWATIRSEYEHGASLRSLAARHGIGKSTIARHKHAEHWIEPLLQQRDSGGTVVQRDTPQAQFQHVPTPQKGPMSDIQRKAAQAAFLAEFEQTAIVSHACKAVGIDRSTVYDWLEHDETFSLLYNQAKEIANDRIRAEILRRGHDGWDEDVYSFGKFQGTVRKYSDTLLIFLAKARMPEFREKQQVEVTTNPDVSGFKELLMARLARLEEQG